MFRKQYWLVAKQTFKTRFKTRGYWLLVLSPLIILALVAGIALIISATNNDKTPSLGVVNDRSVASYLKTDQRLDAKISNVPDHQTAQRQLKNGQLDNYLVEKEGHFIVRTANQSTPVNHTNLMNALTSYNMQRRAIALHLSVSDLQKLMAPTKVKTEVISIRGTTADGAQVRAANSTFSMAMGIGIFIFLTAYVGMIANEIANEKSSRIMEILLAASSPAVQFFGKISGIALLAIFHLALYLVVGIIGMVALPDNAMLDQGRQILAGVDWSFAIVTGLLVLVGIVLYMVLTAIVAALVNDQSQVQQAVAPLSYIAMIGYILSLIVAQQPNNLLIKIISYVPFVSQTLMPARMSIQYAPVWQGWVALGIELLALVYVGRFGLRVYQRNVLQYNDGNLMRAGLASLRGLFVKDQS